MALTFSPEPLYVHDDIAHDTNRYIGPFSSIQSSGDGAVEIIRLDIFLTKEDHDNDTSSSIRFPVTDEIRMPFYSFIFHTDSADDSMVIVNYNNPVKT